MNSLPPTGRVFGTTLAALSLGLLLLTGCNNNSANSPSQPPQGASPGKAAETGAGAASGGTVADKGQAIFAANNCGNCHALNGQGGGKAPDLSKIGAEHDAAWIAAHIKDPKTHTPNSRMPAFDKLSEEELKTVSEYLASLK